MNNRVRFLTRLYSVIFCIGLAAFLFGTATAQSGTTGIRGTVSDQNGAALPGATVTLVNADTGFSRTVTSGDDGQYSFPGIPPATYRLEVTAGNFKKLVNSNVRALVNSPIELNLALEAGDVTAVVNVTSNTIDSVVNNQDASIGNTFISPQIVQLPTDLRNINNLLALQPAVTRDGYVAGGRSDQANITLDGVDINDQQTGGRSFGGDLNQGSALRVTTESVEEFRITTLGANANQGRSSGAQITLISKTGTNNLRGSLFYFNRPTLGSANTFFNNLAGSFGPTDAAVIGGIAKVGDQRVPRPSLDREVYGGTIGGPIKKDKLFFFYSYEGQFQTQETPVNRVVPLAHVGRGEVRFRGTGPSCTGGNCAIQLAELNTIYSLAGINPTAMSTLAAAATAYPSNNTIIGDGFNTGGFLFNAPTTVKQNTHTAKFDWNPNSTNQLYLRGNYQSDNSSGVPAFPNTLATTSWSHPTGLAAGHTWTASSNKINNLRYGLTRQAFSNTGDSEANAISFRFVYSPLLYARTLSRVTNVQNITDDFTWIKGGHTFQIGGNVRIIRNYRNTLANAFDSAVTNPSFYASSGAVVNQRITANGYSITAGGTSVRDAATALIGRYSQYTGQFNYDIDGNTVPIGTPTIRNFATEEYDVYGQDIWKLHRTLTLTLGLRYSLSRPVYERDGFQVIPSTPLGDFFEARRASAANGVPLNTEIQFQLAGPANNAPGFYDLDKNNFQPRVAAAWTPNIGGKVGRFLFGKEGDSVIRGGFGIFNDYFGSQLAVSFDQLSTLGFTTSNTISANTYNVTTRLGPRFTGFNQQIRILDGVSTPPNRFMTPADEQTRIESSLDSTIVSPIHYSWNVSYGRQLPKGMYFEASYLGRKARNLFGSRDVMAINNLVDPATGMDWYTAAGLLVDAQKAGRTFNSIANIPYFEYFFPNAMTVLNTDFGFGATSNTRAIYAMFADDGFAIRDYTFIQLIIDDATEFDLSGNPGRFPNMFYHPQYGAFSAFGTFANSDYHGASFSLRQRFGSTLSYDFNYTLSQSFDDVSGLQTDGSYGGQFLLNPLRQRDQYAPSDFDTRHVINANFLFDLPIGKGKKLLGDINSWADAVIGGWSLRGIYRWNSGPPLSNPYDAAIWATNWNVQSNGTRVRPITGAAIRSTQSFFADAQAAYNSFRNARPGETGERNNFRLPGYSTLDMGLSKTFNMPWSENHKFQFRWEVFNVMNKQYFAAGNFATTAYGLGEDADTCTPPACSAPATFGKIFDDIQGNPRRMQFGLRYSF